MLLLTAVILILINFYNISLVFYDPGHTITLQSPSQELPNYPFMPDAEVKNIILFIADGMGISHLAATRLHYFGPDGKLHIERMPVTGFVNTHTIDDLITDSAASATALATGVKTKSKRISMDADDVSRMTILEAARDAGLWTGLVTSTELTDATPAAFASHVRTRKSHDEIALQLIDSKVNVLLGEGSYFFPQTHAASKRDDDIDVVAQAKNAGYMFVDNETELKNTSADYLLGLFSNITRDRYEVQLETATSTPSLAELTQKAIALLSRRENGFFLMVEEEGADSGSHVNRADYILHYLKQFDDAVKMGLDFAMQDRQTLVIVTADHETGGLNIVKGSRKSKHMEFTWVTDDHTAQPVPLFAFGPQAMRFTGLKDNTDLPKIMAELLRLHAFPR